MSKNRASVLCVVWKTTIRVLVWRTPKLKSTVDENLEKAREVRNDVHEAIPLGIVVLDSTCKATNEAIMTMKPYPVGLNSY